jgi:hypothetical protein
MLQTTVAVADRHHEEHIALERRRLAEQAYLPLADAPQILAQAGGIDVVVTGDRHVVRHAAGLEFMQRETAHFDRVIDQLVVVRGADTARNHDAAPLRPPSPRAAWSRCAIPCRHARRRADVDLARGVCSQPCTIRNTLLPLKKPCVVSRWAARTDRSHAYTS